MEERKNRQFLKEVNHGKICQTLMREHVWYQVHPELEKVQWLKLWLKIKDLMYKLLMLVTKDQN